MASFFTKSAAAIVANGMEALVKKQPDGSTAIGAITKTIVRYPLKALATFVMAPFLAFRVARYAENPLRRTIAAIGLFLALVVAIVTGIFLGTVTAALLTFSTLGVGFALALLFGTLTGVLISVALVIFVFNATSWLFLHMSSQDVIDHLRSITK